MTLFRGEAHTGLGFRKVYAPANCPLSPRAFCHPGVTLAPGLADAAAAVTPVAGHFRPQSQLTTNSLAPGAGRPGRGRRGNNVLGSRGEAVGRASATGREP